jgi:hypothetical protein
VQAGHPDTNLQIYEPNESWVLVAETIDMDNCDALTLRWKSQKAYL